jgi:hypothetical protein
MSLSYHYLCVTVVDMNKLHGPLGGGVPTPGNADIVKLPVPKDP